MNSTLLTTICILVALAMTGSFRAHAQVTITNTVSATSRTGGNIVSNGGSISTQNEDSHVSVTTIVDGETLEDIDYEVVSATDNLVFDEREDTRDDTVLIEKSATGDDGGISVKTSIVVGGHDEVAPEIVKGQDATFTISVPNEHEDDVVARGAGEKDPRVIFVEQGERIGIESQSSFKGFFKKIFNYVFNLFT
jgi:hypothetical protein